MTPRGRCPSILVTSESTTRCDYRPRPAAHPTMHHGGTLGVRLHWSDDCEGAASLVSLPTRRKLARLIND